MVLTGTPDNAGCWCESYCARRVRLPTAREAFGFLYDHQGVQDFLNLGTLFFIDLDTYLAIE